ncbi:DeoR/GlpR family DNA-binding transcription regulator [Amaricoccus macauensis]|uniref:DeoR/GlpR family DNA-binding transcription regulator n=1 Tax=Amaricoccus macauensis TaxID=57001 RepID=UPI003C7BA303
MELNNPEVRLGILRERIATGASLIALDLATEFGVSLDTIRRDLIALELAGTAKRVRGGAVPIIQPSGPLRDRPGTDFAIANRIALCALQRLRGARTLLIDGGTTCVAFARVLQASPSLTVITPSPFVAVETFKRGIETLTLPGRLSESGGISVGISCQEMLEGIAADTAVLGACALDAEFGLSSDDILESTTKRSLSRAASETFVLTDARKVGSRTRYRTLCPSEIDVVVTNADIVSTKSIEARDVEVIHA